jgi:hypothetical protein
MKLRVFSWHEAADPGCPQFGRYRGKSGRRADGPGWPRMTQLYGPAVRCKPNADMQERVPPIKISLWTLNDRAKRTKSPPPVRPRPALRMSANWGRPEVSGTRSK